MQWDLLYPGVYTERGHYFRQALLGAFYGMVLGNLLLAHATDPTRVMLPFLYQLVYAKSIFSVSL